MSLSEKEYYQLNELILRMLDRTIMGEQFKCLEEMLSSNPEIQDYYLRIVKICSSLGHHARPAEVIAGPENYEEVIDPELWTALARSERTAEGIEVEKSSPAEVSDLKYSELKKVARGRRHVSKLPLYTAIFSTAALVLVMLYVFLNPRIPLPVVAWLSDSMDAKWEDANFNPSVDEEITAGPLKLLRGVAEITMGDGAVVVIHAPAELNLETTKQVFLQSGKIYSRVPKSSLGFVVRTPRATVVDYGTEFGVVVDRFSQTEAKVFKGQVELRTGSDPLVFGLSSKLEAGQEGKVDDSGSISTSEFAINEWEFVRSVQDIRESESMLNKNLIVNGDFEADPVIYHPQFKEGHYLNNNINISGWQDESGATVIPYEGIAAGYTEEDRSDLKVMTTSPNKGKLLFVGVEEWSIYQDIDLSRLVYKIDGGNIRFEVSGWFGGWKDHGDTAEMTVRFFGRAGNVLREISIGKVTTWDRQYRANFLKRSEKGFVPAGSVKVQIELKSYKITGSADSYADDLELILRQK